MRVRERLKLKERQRKKERKRRRVGFVLSECGKLSELKVTSSSSTLAALSFVFLLTHFFFSLSLVNNGISILVKFINYKNLIFFILFSSPFIYIKKNNKLW